MGRARVVFCRCFIGSAMGPGDLVAGRFELERLAGEGGMGAVWRALDRASGARVALKLLSPRLAAREGPRFLREAKVLAALDHPAVVGYVASGESQGELYLAMEWLEGEDLGQRLERERLDIGEAVLLCARVAEALAVAHRRGIVH